MVAGTYLRLINRNNQFLLQTAAVRCSLLDRRTQREFSVDLLSVVHLAEPAYFSALQDACEQYDLDGSKILTWDPPSSAKPTLKEDETAKMQTVHDNLKRLVGKAPYIMLRTHDIEAGAWTAGLASTPKARYRCARLAMLVVRYATDRDVRPCGSVAHRQFMQASRSLFPARK